MRQLSGRKGIKTGEAEACPDYVHMLLEIWSKRSVSSFMGDMKGRSGRMQYEPLRESKYKYRSREFWRRGYILDTAGKNESHIAEYIANQSKEDELGEQLTMSKLGPFTGGK